MKTTKCFFLYSVILYVSLFTEIGCLNNASASPNLIRVGFHRSCSSIGGAQHIAVEGNTAYLADSEYLRVLDIRNPSTPVEVDKLPVSDDYVTFVTVKNNYVFVGTYGDKAGVYIYDGNDMRENKRGVLEFGTGVKNVLDIAVDKARAYAALGVSGIRIIDIRWPLYPTVLGSYVTPGEAKGIAVSGDYAYVADGLRGLRIINIKDPAKPFEVGSEDGGCGTVPYPSNLTSVAVSGSYAYVTDTACGLRIVNVSDPTNPYYKGSPSFGYMTLGRHLSLSGKYLFVPTQNEGTFVLDIGNPSSPVEVAHYDRPEDAIGYMSGGTPSNVAVFGDFLFLSILEQGVDVLRLGRTVHIPLILRELAHNWKDILDIYNAGVDGADAVLTLFDAAGGVVYEDAFTVGALTNRNLLLGDISSEAASGKIGYIDPNLQFRLLSQNLLGGGGISEVALSSETHAKLAFHYPTYDSQFPVKVFFIKNTGKTHVNVALFATGDDMFFEGANMVIPPDTRKFGAVSSWFEEIPAAHVAQVFAIGDDATLAGVALSFSADFSRMILSPATSTPFMGP